MKKILVITGPTAAGKDTTMIKVMKRLPNLKPLISYTTRPIREVETDGVEYNFIGEDEYHSIKNSGGIMSARVYNTIQKGKKATWHYGAPYPKEDGYHITIVDHQGVKNIINAIGRENTFVVYLDAPDYVLEDRCRNRGDEMAEFYRRLADDRIKFKGIENVYNLFIKTNLYTPEEVASIIDLHILT